MSSWGICRTFKNGEKIGHMIFFRCESLGLALESMSSSVGYLDNLMDGLVQFPGRGERKLVLFTKL
jgi:hypothetical protein